MFHKARSVFLVIVLCVGGLVHGGIAQEGAPLPSSNAKAELVDEFWKVGECDFTGRMDVFMYELSKRPDHQGYIINYLGLDTLPGDREKHSRERMIVNHISFRNFDRSRITIVRGGFRQEVGTELWLVPPNAEYPSPSRTVPEPKISVNKTFLYERSFIYSDEIDLLNEFVLESVKRREEEEIRRAEEEVARADEEARKNSKPEEIEPEGKEGQDTSSDAVDLSDETDVTDRLSPEQREEARFSWIDGKIWRFLQERKNDSAVIIFYADDERYDTAQLQAFVVEARDKIASLARIKPSRVRVVFGGYRDQPQAEFWVVPPNGRRPTPMPELRPESDSEEN